MNFWLVVEPTPLKNMLVKMGSSCPNRGENKKCLKPPSSHEFCSNHEIHINWMVGRIEATGWWEKTPPGFLFGAFGICIFRGVRRLLLNFRWVPFFSATGNTLGFRGLSKLMEMNERQRLDVSFSRCFSCVSKISNFASPMCRNTGRFGYSISF